MLEHEWIFLYGPPGSGKSSIGQLVGRALGLPFVDLDLEIEKTSGTSIPDIFALQGEAVFRRIERETLQRLLATLQPGVVALGGGTLLDPNNRAMVSSCGPVVCLSASMETLQERIRSTVPNRPLLSGELVSRLAELLDNRSEHYSSFSLQFCNDGFSLEQSVWNVQVLLGRFHVCGMGKGYDAWMMAGGLDQLGQVFSSRGLQGPVAVVCDEHVGPLYVGRVLRSLQSAGLDAYPLQIKAGERHKNIQAVQALWEGFLQIGLERSSTVVALGGGVTGDLAGFAASTFMRGVGWVVVPTSLLAMVDASLGGKTGVDLPQGKNLLGAFYPPLFVLADPQALSTLPKREVRSGMAEVIKAAVIADPELLDTCALGWEMVTGHWEEVVPRAMAVKVRFIQADPYEKGPRAALNLGHTVGHALERVSDYKISHGEAVSIGMVIETFLAEQIGLAQLGLAERIASILARFGLPTHLPVGLKWETILASMQVDKKRQAGSLRFALPAAIGDVRTGVVLKPQELASFKQPI
jgi:shikimate kinase/3-dehydroquinate synthase